MSVARDHLYDLLPAVYRQRDAAEGFPLRTLLRIVAEQVDGLGANLGELYDDWFIETCAEWVVPYIGDLVGHRPVREAGEPGSAAAGAPTRIVVARADVANTIRTRRRKGTLALLEELAADVARWPARAVEVREVLAASPHVDHVHLRRGGTPDVRDGDALERIEGPFDTVARTAAVVGRTAAIPDVHAFVWRLEPHSVTHAPAWCLDDRPHCFTFSIVGHDSQLFQPHRPVTDPTEIAEEAGLPVPISRRRLARHRDRIYGASFTIWLGAERVPAEKIVAADLDEWQYEPASGEVAVDPERGRLAFTPGYGAPSVPVFVSYHYGFSADVGGGEYPRLLSAPREHTVYRVGPEEADSTINGAIERWRKDQSTGGADGANAALRHAVIEVTDSGLYEERLDLELRKRERLQLRARNGARPVLAVGNPRRAMADAAIRVRGERGSRFTLHGFLVVGGPIRIMPPASHRAGSAAPGPDLAEICIRHSTLVPGWGVGIDCKPHHPAKPSLELVRTSARLIVEHSILGAISVDADEVETEPVSIRIDDSILDATAATREALGAPGGRLAHAHLTIRRSTVFGCVEVHAIELAENTIFDGNVRVARRQHGCIRFCYVTPGSRTPRQFACQPATALGLVAATEAAGDAASARARVESRVRPVFNSRRYGNPTYCQLALRCPVEILRGADDASEMGVFHDLYQPQRLANLRARLEEHTPAGLNARVAIVT